MSDKYSCTLAVFFRSHGIKLVYKLAVYLVIGVSIVYSADFGFVSVDINDRTVSFKHGHSEVRHLLFYPCAVAPCIFVVSDSVEARITLYKIFHKNV